MLESLIQKAAKAADKSAKKAAKQVELARQQQAQRQKERQTMPQPQPQSGLPKGVWVDEWSGEVHRRVTFAHPHPEWPVMDMSGTEEVTLYTYDAEMLDGMPDGAWIEVEAVPYDVELYSSRAGSLHNSEEYGTAVAFYGVVIGITSGWLECLKDIAASGRRVKFRAVKKGMLEDYDGIPRMVCQVVDPKLIKAWWRIEKRTPGKYDLSENNRDTIEAEGYKELRREWRESDLGIKLPDEWEDVDIYVGDALPYAPQTGITPIDVSTELMPTPKGSKAKPKVSIRIAGIEILQASAYNGYYETVVAHAGEEPLGAYIRKVDYETGDPTVRLVIVWPK